MPAVVSQLAESEKKSTKTARKKKVVVVETDLLERRRCAHGNSYKAQAGSSCLQGHRAECQHAFNGMCIGGLTGRDVILMVLCTWRVA